MRRGSLSSTHPPPPAPSLPCGHLYARRQSSCDPRRASQRGSPGVCWGREGEKKKRRALVTGATGVWEHFVSRQVWKSYTCPGLPVRLWEATAGRGDGSRLQGIKQSFLTGASPPSSLSPAAPTTFASPLPCSPPPSLRSLAPSFFLPPPSASHAL